MVVRAAEIVSQLRPAADGARSSLRFVADEHWSPAVRAFAVDVLQTLDDLSAPARKLNPSAVSFTHGYKWCVPESGYTEGPDATGNEVSVPRNPVWRFSYQGTVQERRLADWPKAAIPSEFPVACYRGVPANPCSWIDLPGDPLGETTIQPVQNGWLVSIHRGEFGGVVLFIAREGTGHRLADAVPVEGFAVVPGGMLGFHAYCQSGCQGVVQRLESNHGEWHVTRTTELPSAPRGIWREADGTILVATEQGVVSLDASGAITGFPGCL